MRILSPRYLHLILSWTCLLAGCGDDTTSGTTTGEPPSTKPTFLVSNSRGDDLVRYDQETGAFVDTFVAKSTGKLLHPDSMGIGPDGALYVSSGDKPENSAIVRFNAETGTFEDEFAKGNGLHRPYGFAFGSDAKLYVASFLSDEILRYDANNGTFIDSFKKGDGMPGGLNGPNGLAFGPDGKLYVTTEGTVAVNGEATFPGLPSQVLQIDIATGNMSVFIDQPAMGSGGLGYVSLLGIVFEKNCTTQCRIYVSDFANDIRVYDWPSGMLASSISTNYTKTMPSSNNLGSVTIGENGNIFTCGFEATSAVGTVLRFDASGMPSPATGKSDAIFVDADARLNRPIGILALPR